MAERVKAPLIVLFDLETTSIHHDSDICQIAALPVTQISQYEMFSCYLVPTIEVSPGATRVNHLQIKETKNKGRILTKCGVKVEALKYKDGLLSFYQYLTQLQAAEHDKQIVLTAHNGKGFDFPVLQNAFSKISVTLAQMNISFADTLLILRAMQKENHPILSSRESPKVIKWGISLSQENIYETLFKEKYSAHDAVEDVWALNRILFESTLQVTADVILQKSFTM